ncbi:MAG: PAS domain S-box protein, partial [Anaerolineales bacterium]
MSSNRPPETSSEGSPDLREAEARYRQLATEFAECQQISHLGSWQWDIATGTVRWSDELYRIYGLEPGSVPIGYEGFLERVHPDDRERVRAIITAAYRDHQPFSFEHRIVRPDGAVRTLQARGEVKVNENGEPVRMAGTGHDVTEFNQALADLRTSEAQLRSNVEELQVSEEELRQQAEELQLAHQAVLAERQRYQDLFESAPDGYLVTDLHGNIQRANQAASLLLNLPKQNLVNKPFTALVAPEAVKAFRAELNRARESRQVSDWQTRLQPREHEPFEAALRVAPARDPQGRVLALRWLVQDITERVQAQAQIRQLNAQLEQRVRERTKELEAANEELEVEIEERQQTEAELRESEGRYRQLVELSPDTIFVQTEGRIAFINPAGARLLGADNPEQLIGKPVLDIIHPDYHDVVKERIRLGNAGQTVPLIEEKFLRLDGGAVDVEATAAPFIYQGRPAVQVIAHNITQRKQAEQALKARERQQAVVAQLGERALADADIASLMDEALAQVSLTLAAGQCKILELLPDGEALLVRIGLGWPPGVVGHTLVPAGPESQAGYTLATDESVIVEDLRTATRFVGMPILHEHGIISGMTVIIPGRERPFGVLGAHTTQPRQFTPDDANFLQVVANILASAIERKRAEEAMRVSEERYRSLVEAMTSVVWTADPNGEFVVPQPAWEAYTGQRWPEYQGMGWLQAIHPDDREQVQAAGARAIAERSLYQSEGRLWHAASGAYRYYSAHAVTLLDASGQAREWVGAVTDEHERKQAEQALKFSRDQLDVILQNVADGITAQGPDGQLRYANDAAARLTGYPTAEALLQAPLPEIMQRFEVLDEAGQPFPLGQLPGRLALLGDPAPLATLRFRVRASNEERWSAVKARPVFDARGQVQLAVNIFQDITDLKRNELAQRTLAEVGRVLAGSLDYKTRLTNVAE